VRLVAHAIENEKYSGVVNAVSPEPIRNKRLTLELERVLSVVAIAPIPTTLLEMLYGEMSEVLLSSQRVYPHKALSMGFSFKFNLLKMALQDILGHHRSGEKEVINEMYLEGSLDSVKEHFLRCHLAQAGQRDYPLVVGKFSFTFRSEIEENADKKRVTERQIKGPYKTWVRSLEFFPLAEGVLVKETIRYGLKLSWLPDWLGARKLVEQHLKQLH
jgi:hypothetical protein